MPEDDNIRRGEMSFRTTKKNGDVKVDFNKFYETLLNQKGIVIEQGPDMNQMSIGDYRWLDS